MTGTTYNNSHWESRVQQYLASDWSHQPSPFALFAMEYFPANAVILELGAGAGQDGLWFAKNGAEVTITDATSKGFDEINKRAKSMGARNITIVQIDVSTLLPFEDNSFDVVYAQQVLHYFDDSLTHKIMAEIARVLRPGGIIAALVNSIEDPEYRAAKSRDGSLIDVDGLVKRFFSTTSFEPFTKRFKQLVLDNHGTTAKDQLKGVANLIRFIGRKA